MLVKYGLYVGNIFNEMAWLQKKNKIYLLKIGKICLANIKSILHIGTSLLVQFPCKYLNNAPVFSQSKVKFRPIFFANIEETRTIISGV